MPAWLLNMAGRESEVAIGTPLLASMNLESPSLPLSLPSFLPSLSCSSSILPPSLPASFHESPVLNIYQPLAGGHRQCPQGISALESLSSDTLNPGLRPGDRPEPVARKTQGEKPCTHAFLSLTVSYSIDNFLCRARNSPDCPFRVRIEGFTGSEPLDRTASPAL